jgi:hypothetical protein
VAYVAGVDPNQAGHYPPCPFLFLTGLYCPGCGGLRAVHALAHGDVGAALGLNPLLVVMIPLLAVWWADWTVRTWRGLPMREGFRRAAGIWVFLGVLIVYWVARNLPFAAFLGP